jgi:hemoglobin
MYQAIGARKWIWPAICCGLIAASSVYAATPDDSLYSRLGGTTNVTAIVADMFAHAVSDPHLKRSFEDVNMERLNRLVVEHICALTGGGCEYSGDSMHDAHAGLGISEAEFFRFTQVLRDSMRRHGVPLRARNELLRILAPMKRDIVER